MGRHATKISRVETTSLEVFLHTVTERVLHRTRNWGPQKQGWPRLKTADVDAIMDVIEASMPPGLPSRRGERPNYLSKIVHGSPELSRRCFGSRDEALMYSVLTVYTFEHVRAKLLEVFQRKVANTPGCESHIVVERATGFAPSGGHAQRVDAAPEGVKCASCGTQVLSGWRFPLGGTWCDNCAHAVTWG